MRFRTILFWILATLLVAAVNYFYHSTLLLAAVSSALVMALMVLAGWSLAKVGSGPRALVLTLVISLVGGFMLNQGFDVLYVLFAAPEGMRFIMPLEIVIFGLVLALGASASRWVSGSKPEK